MRGRHGVVRCVVRGGIVLRYRHEVYCDYAIKVAIPMSLLWASDMWYG